MRLRLLFLPALFVALSLQAQTPVVSWIKKNGPLGGRILDIERDATTNKLYLIDGKGRPYVSIDNGNVWAPISFTGSDIPFNDIEITNGTIFLVASYNLYASIDGGVSFQERMTEVSPYFDARRLKRMPVSGDLVVLAYQSIYTSSNNGQTWTQTNSTLGNADLRYLEVNSVDQIFILRPNPITFEVKPYRSVNGGSSFSEQATGITAGKHVLGLYGQNDGGKIYGITSDNIFSSTNATSWASIKSAAISDAIICDYGDLQNSFIEVSADGTGMFFIDNVNHKLYSKTAAGTAWELQATDFPSDNLSALCATAQDYPSATTATAYFGTQAGVFRSTTGGSSVSEKNAGIAGVQGVQILADYNNALYLRTESVGILKSENQGNSWANVSNLTPSLKQFFKSEDGSYLYAVTTENILLRSYDRGSNWYEVSPLGGFEWAGAADSEKVFGLQSSYSPLSLYYSGQNANSWTASPVTVSGLPANFAIESYPTTRMSFASANRMFLYLYDYGLSAYAYYRIDFTYDGSNVITSAVATKITSIPILFNDIYKVATANGKIYLYQSYGAAADRIAISADGGVNWTTRSVPVSDDFFVASNGYIFLTDNSNDDKLYLSRDNGATFEETDLPNTINLFNLEDITLDNNGFAYLAVNGDYLYQSINTIVLPAAPSGLAEVGHTARAGVLKWVDPNDFDVDIIIERSLDGVNFSIAGQVSGSSACYATNSGYYIDSDVSPNTGYTYRIKAKNGAGESTYSSTISFTTLSDCPSTIPENNSWTATNSGAESYPPPPVSPVDVAIKHLGGGEYEISNLSLGLTGSNVSSTFFASCGQTVVGDARGGVLPNGMGSWNGTTLTLKWRTCYDDTETITLTVNATDPAPTKPEALYAFVVSNTSIEIRWTSAYYEKSYVLERSSTSVASGFTPIATIPYPEKAYTDNGPLVAGTTYYYRLKSLNGNATPDPSPYSDVVTVPFNKPNFLVASNAITDYNSMPTIGSIWADFNNDGLDDYLTMKYDEVNELATPLIFKNLGGGSFEQIDIDLGAGDYFLPSVADYDNDHFPDIVFSGDESRILGLFKGNGDFTFAKVPSGQLGDLAIIEKNISYTSWADINNDGLPDILLLNEEDGSFTLFRQNSNHSFTRVMQGPPSANNNLLSIWADYDNDGYQDVFFGNQFDGAGVPELYRNNGDETFTKVTGNGLDATTFLGAAWGDYNNDGNMDLFCGSTAMNALFKNNGDGTFTKDETTLISEANFTSSASWGDYNNDGYLDLLAAAFPVGGSQTRLFLRDPSVTSSVAFKKIITEKINDLSVAHYTVANADPDQNGLLDVEMSTFLFDDIDDGLAGTNNNFYKNNNTLANWTEVKLVPVSGGTEALGARITLTAGGKTQTREIAAASSLLSRNSTIAHFGLGSATTVTNIQVKWPNGGIQNYPLPPINQIITITEDVTGPVISTRTPDHNATAVATTTTLTMVFNEEPFSVNGKMIEVTKIGEATAFTAVDASTGTKTGNQIVYTLPVGLQGETQYRVTIEAGAFRDRWLNPSLAVGPLQWWFTTGAVVDVTPPDINFSIPASPPKGSVPANFPIVVTDVGGVGVNTVVVSIRPISGSSYANVPASLSAADIYSVPISESTHFDATGAEFFITATDLAGNTVRDPEGTGTHKVYLTYDETQSAIPSGVLGFGGAKANWKVFAVPFELASTNGTISNIFNEIAALDKQKDYRLITINDTRDNWKEYPSFTEITRGLGYFINIREVVTIKLFNDLTAPANSRANLFPVTLKPGWNMVGNPYLTQIDWADVSTYNDLSGDAASLVKYNGTGYAASSQILLPYEGGFVNNPTNSDIAISVPFDGQIASGGRTKSFEFDSDINSEQWIVGLSLNQQEHKYEMGAIGMSPDAGASLDIFDRITPPRFFDYLELNFSHPEHFQKRFTRDVVPTQSSHTWEFTVDSNLEGQAELYWDNSAFYSGAKDLYLLDISSQILLNMKETGSYQFDSKESSRFRIYYGDNLNIAPERVQLGKAYPNPTKGLTTIGFSLPETGGLNQTATIEILDALGRTVGTLTNGMFNPGYHEAAFDATEMMNGFYTYRLTVKNRRGNVTEVNKLIIK